MFILSCRVCSVEFEAKTQRRAYCTQRCKDRGKPSASGLSCFICDKPMVKGRTSMPQGEAAHNACRTQSGGLGEHGASGYRQGCRCDVCKGGQAARMREYLPKYRAAYKAKYGEHPGTAYVRRYREKHGHRPPNSGSWIDPKLRFELYGRDGWACLLCGDPIDQDAHWNGNLAPSLDHIVPRSLGGSHDPENLRTAHRACNSARGVGLDF